MYTEYVTWGRLIYDKLHGWLQSAVKMTPNLVVAFLALLLFVVIARLVRKLAYRIIFRVTDTVTVSALFSTLLYILLLFVGVFIALDVMKLEKTVSSLLAGAGIIGLALGFAFQDLTANFISGIFITFRKPFETGHIIETNSFTGTVEQIQLRSTTLRTYDGLHVMIPNKDIFQKPIINHSLTPERRVEVPVVLPGSMDITIFSREVTQALQVLPDVSKSSPIVLLTGIDGGNVKAVVRCWINNEREESYEETLHQVIQAVTGFMPGFRNNTAQGQ